MSADYRYERGDVATVNHEEETDLCAQVAAKLVGADQVNDRIAPMMGSKDFG